MQGALHEARVLVELLTELAVRAHMCFQFYQERIRQLEDFLHCLIEGRGVVFHNQVPIVAPQSGEVGENQLVPKRVRGFIVHGDNHVLLLGDVPVDEFVKRCGSGTSGQDPRVALAQSVTVVYVLRVPAQGDARGVAVDGVKRTHAEHEVVQGVQDCAVIDVEGQPGSRGSVVSDIRGQQSGDIQPGPQRVGDGGGLDHVVVLRVYKPIRRVQEEVRDGLARLAQFVDKSGRLFRVVEIAQRFVHGGQLRQQSEKMQPADLFPQVEARRVPVVHDEPQVPAHDVVKDLLGRLERVLVAHIDARLVEVVNDFQHGDGAQGGPIVLRAAPVLRVCGVVDVPLRVAQRRGVVGVSDPSTQGVVGSLQMEGDIQVLQQRVRGRPRPGRVRNNAVDGQRAVPDPLVEVVRVRLRRRRNHYSGQHRGMWPAGANVIEDPLNGDVPLLLQPVLQQPVVPTCVAGGFVDHRPIHHDGVPQLHPRAVIREHAAVILFE